MEGRRVEAGIKGFRVFFFFWWFVFWVFVSVLIVTDVWVVEATTSRIVHRTRISQITSEDKSKDRNQRKRKLQNYKT